MSLYFVIWVLNNRLNQPRSVEVARFEGMHLRYLHNDLDHGIGHIGEAKCFGAVEGLDEVNDAVESGVTGSSLKVIQKLIPGNVLLCPLLLRVAEHTLHLNPLEDPPQRDGLLQLSLVQCRCTEEAADEGVVGEGLNEGQSPDNHVLVGIELREHPLEMRKNFLTEHATGVGVPVDIGVESVGLELLYFLLLSDYPQQEVGEIG